MHRKMYFIPLLCDKRGEYELCPPRLFIREVETKSGWVGDKVLERYFFLEP